MSNQINWKPKGIKLNQSINTSTVDNDIKPIDPNEGESPHLENNGIIKEGGISSIYKVVDGLSLVDYNRTASNGKTIGFEKDFDDEKYEISLNGAVIGKVGGWGITENRKFYGYTDLLLVVSTSPGFIGLKFDETTLYIDNLNNQGQLSSTRSINYTSSIPATTRLIHAFFVRGSTVGFAGTKAVLIFSNFVVKMFDTTTAAFFTMLSLSAPAELSAEKDKITNCCAYAVVGSTNNRFVFCSNSSYYNSLYINNFENTVASTIDGVNFLYPEENYHASQASDFTMSFCSSGDSLFKRITVTSSSVTQVSSYTFPYYVGTLSKAPGWVAAETTSGESSIHVLNHRAWYPFTTDPVSTSASGDGFPSFIDQTSDFFVKFDLNRAPNEGEIGLALCSYSIAGSSGGYGFASYDFNGVTKDDNRMNLASPLTIIGEADNWYTFQSYYGTAPDSYVRLLLKNNDTSFSFFKLDLFSEPKIEEIASGVYLLNTQTAELSVLDTNNSYLTAGPSCLNFSGVILSVADLPSEVEVSVPIAFSKTGPFLTYPDKGDLVSSMLTNSDLEGDGPGPLMLQSLKGAYVEDFTSFVEDESYYFQYTSSGISWLATPIEEFFIPRVDIPAPIFSVYQGGGINMTEVSAIQYPGKPSYMLENQINQDFEFFSLYGQIYGFDGYQIWIVTGSYGGTIGVPYPIAIANGLVYLCTSTVAVWFLSNFDNSLWSFDGGRSVTKQVDLSQEEPILSGAWSVKDNELILRTRNTVLFARDGIITRNLNPFTGAPDFNIDVISLGSEQVGYRFTYSNYYGYFSYKIIGPVLGLLWQSAYFGPSDNQLSSLNKVALYLKLPSSTPLVQTLTLTHKWFTESESGTTTATLTTVTPNAQGYARLWWVPTKQRALGHSIGLSTADGGVKLVLLEVVPYWSNSEDSILQPLNNFS